MSLRGSKGRLFCFIELPSLGVVSPEAQQCQRHLVVNQLHLYLRHHVACVVWLMTLFSITLAVLHIRAIAIQWKLRLQTARIKLEGETIGAKQRLNLLMLW